MTELLAVLALLTSLIALAIAVWLIVLIRRVERGARNVAATARRRTQDFELPDE